MKKYRIIANSNNHGFKIGEIVEANNNFDGDYGYDYPIEMSRISGAQVGFVKKSDCEEITEPLTKTGGMPISTDSTNPMPQPQPRYRLFNAATDSLEDLSKLRTRHGNRIKFAEQTAFQAIVYVDELYNRVFVYADWRYDNLLKSSHRNNDLMISIPAPVEVKQYQNQYIAEDLRGFWHQSILAANVAQMPDEARIGMSERTFIDNKLVSIRLLSTNEYENIV